MATAAVTATTKWTTIGCLETVHPRGDKIVVIWSELSLTFSNAKITRERTAGCLA